MIWVKRDASKLGTSDALPGWVTDAGRRDSSILMETLKADPEADSIEARLIQAMKASKKADKDSAHIGNHEHAEDERGASHSRAAATEDEEGDDEKRHRHASSSKDDEDHHKETRTHSKTSKDDDDDDERESRHHRSDEDDDAKRESSKRSSHRRDDDDDKEEEYREEEEKPKKLSGAARLIERISRGHEASLGKHGEANRDSADLGRVVPVTTADDPNGSAMQSSHTYLAVGVLAVLAAIAAGTQFSSSKSDDETIMERIPLVVNSVATSEASPSRATWQKEAAKRRGMQFGFISSDGEADEIC
jgi:hypothetical protein